ncbi:MAG: sugar ABC transporter permease [Clostridia bacterium]|nr:sugar ABC transporter permease [Clostridia bacterium]
MQDNLLLKRNAKKRLWQRNIPLILLALPGFIYLVLFNYLPMFGVVIAFKDFSYIKGILGSDWVGFKYFRFFFESNDAAVVIRNSVLYQVWFHIIGTVCSIVVALLLYNIESRRALKVYQTVIIIPYFISWVLVAYLGFALFSNRFGILNSVLGNMGMAPIDWYAEPKYWPFILTLFYIWKGTGMSCIIYYATLMGIDSSLFEAAKIDGANRARCIWHVAIPALVPVICIMSILAIGSIMGGDFGLFYQVPRNSGALYSVTDIINTYVYRGLQAGNMSQTAAVGLFQSVVGLILVVITNVTIRKVSPENAMF